MLNLDTFNNMVSLCIKMVRLLRSSTNMNKLIRLQRSSINSDPYFNKSDYQPRLGLQPRRMLMSTAALRALLSTLRIRALLGAMK